MLRELQNVGKVLGDKTRTEILEFVINSEQPVSIIEVARHFGLHQNAARMHLSKLESVHFLRSSMRRNSGGGRPAKMYQMGDHFVNIQFPARQYRLLAETLLGIIAADQVNASKRMDSAGIEYGKKLAQKAAAEHEGQLPLDPAALVAAYIEAENRFGCMPKFESATGQTYQISFHNCVFKELVKNESKYICTFHRSIMKGFFSQLGKPIKLKVIEAEAQNGGKCVLDLVF